MNEATMVWAILLGIALICSALAHVVLRTFIIACGIGAITSVVVFHLVMYYTQGGFGMMWEIGAIVNFIVAVAIAIVVGILVRRLRPPTRSG
jgi:K+-sensing histidine kinase KdpD